VKVILKTYSLSILFLLVLLTTAYGDTYKWVDEQGVIHFQDYKPSDVDSAKVETLTVEELKFNNYVDSAKDTENKSYYQTSDREKTGKGNKKKKRYSHNQKVELYVTSWCGYCKKAKAFFNTRNISFEEYDVEKDKSAASRHRELNRRGGVPVAVINGKTILGFSESAYENALKKR